MRQLWLIIGLIVLTTGCATSQRPMTWVQREVPWTSYKAFVVEPVVNETGKTFEDNLAGTMQQHLKDGLREQGHLVVEEQGQPEGVVLLRSRLIVYDPGNAAMRLLGRGQGQCILRAMLVDAKTERLLADLVSAQETQTGGIVQGAVGVLSGVGAETAMVHNCVQVLLDEITKRVKGV